MSYLKNVGKSIGYAIPAIIEDKFKDLGQLSKMVANPKQFKTLFKDSVKDMLNDTSSDMNSEIVGPIKKMYGRASKAAMTGNYFRSEKERTASAFEAFGGDFNMDFDFSTESLESSMDDSTDATYENTNAIYETGVMQVATSTRAAKSITSELSRLSSLTYELSKLQTELTRSQISEAGKYYASSLGFLGEMNESMGLLKNEMVALRMVSASPDIFKGPNAQNYYEVLTASNFNMKSYFNYLGKKAKNSSTYSMLSMAGMMGSMMDPVEEAVKAMFSPITNSKFGKRMQSLNKAIGAMPLFALRSLAGKDFGESMLGEGVSSLFKFLNVDYVEADKRVNMKTDIRTVPWDAESKDALVVVIPHLLSEMLSALKKEDFEEKGKHWNPNTGKFETRSEIKRTMMDEVNKNTDYDALSQSSMTKSILDTQTFTGATDEEKNKQKKALDIRIGDIVNKTMKAHGGVFDINSNKVVDEGILTDSKDIELFKAIKTHFNGLGGFDKFNAVRELEQNSEARQETLGSAMNKLYNINANKDRHISQNKTIGLENLKTLTSGDNTLLDVDKLKTSNNNNNTEVDNFNGAGGNPPANDSFFDKMRKLIDGSYLFTKLNGFLDTTSDKFSKIIFGDDTFVGPKKSFFQTLKDGIKDKIDKFSEVFKETFKPLQDYFTQTLVPNISKMFSGVKKYLVDDLYKGIMGGKTLLGDDGILTKAKEKIKDKYTKVKEFVVGEKDEQGLETSEGAFKKIYKSLGFEFIFNNFKNGVKSLGNVLKDNTEKLAKFFNKHLFKEGGLLKGLGDKISTFFKDTTDTIKKDILSPLKDFLVGDDGVLTKAKEDIKNTILLPIKDFFTNSKTGLFNDDFKAKFKNTFIKPFQEFFMGNGFNKQNLIKRVGSKLNKDVFFGKETKTNNKEGIQATTGGMFGDSSSFLYKFLFGTSSVDSKGKVTKNKKGLLDNLSEKGTSKFLIEKLSDTIFKPFSNYLMGDENKPGILRKFAGFLDDNIANPIKGFLFGDDEKEGALDKFKNSFNTFLFGDGTDKRKGVIGDYLKPATDFLKVQLLDPFLDTMKNQWTDMKTFFKEGVLEPLITSFDGLGTSIGIKITNLAKEGKGLFVDAFKSTLQVANESIGNMLSSSSKTLTDMMKENVLDPIKSTLDKLRTGMWAVLKGFIKIPINAFSAVTDKIKISNLIKGEGGHLSESQQARLLEVHNKTAKDKDKKESWGEQKKYFGDNGEEIKKGGLFSSFMDKLHDNRKNREESTNKDSVGKKLTDLNYSEEHKESQKNKQKTLKNITDSAKIDVASQNNSFGDIKNLSENSDKSTQSLSDLLDVFKNPIPEITTSIKDIKDNVLKYIREHSLTNINDNKAKKDNSSSENKEGDKKNNELKESSKEIKSTNGLLTDIRDGVDTMIYVLKQGLHVGSEGGSNIRGGKISGGSLGRVLEGLILNPLGMIKSVFEGGFKAITDSIGSVFKVVTEPLIQVTKSIGEGVRSFFKLIGKVGGIVEGLSKLGGKLLTGIGNLIGDISTGVGTLLKDSAEIFGGIAKDLGSVLSTVVTSTMNVLEGVSEALKPLTEFVFKGIGSILGMIIVGITQSAKIAKGLMKTAGGFLGDMFGIKFGEQYGKMVKKISIDGGMLTGITDVVKVFVTGGNLDSLNNTNKNTIPNKSPEAEIKKVTKTGSIKESLVNMKDNVSDKLKESKEKYTSVKKFITNTPELIKNKKDSIKESLVGMRNNAITKIKETREKLMLFHSENTVKHLAAIRSSGKNLLDLFMMGLPLLISGVGSLITWFMASKAGSLLKGAGSAVASGAKGVGSLIGKGVSKVGSVLVGASKLKLGLGAAAVAGSMVADKYMDKGIAKDVTTTGLDVAGGALTGAAIGSAVPVVGTTIGAVVGGLLAATGNLDKIANIGKATWSFIAGSEAKVDKNGNLIKKDKESIVEKIQNKKDAEVDKKSIINKPIIDKKNNDSSFGKISDIFTVDFWLGSKGSKTDKGRILKEAKKGVLTSLTDIPINFFKSIGESIGEYVFDTVNNVKGFFNKVVDNLKNGFNYVKDSFFSIIDTVTKLPEKIKEGFNSIVDNISKLPGKIWDSLVNVVSSFGGMLLDLVKSPFKYITNFFGSSATDTNEVIKESDIARKDVIMKQLSADKLTDTHGIFFKNTSINKDAVSSLKTDDVKAILNSADNLSNDTKTALEDRLKETPIKRATGGIVKGKGTETSDSIPAKLSNNEYVLNANSVKMLGKGTLDKINNLGLATKDNVVDSGSSIAGSALTGSVIGPGGTIAGLGYGIYDNGKNIAKIGSKAYNKMISNIFPWLADKRGKMINFTSEKIFPWLSDKTGKLINFTSEKIFPWLSETASSIGKSISNGVSNAWEGAKNIAGDVSQGISNVASSVSDSVSTGVSSIGSAVKSAHSGAVDATSSAMSGVADKYNSITKVGGSTKNMMKNVLAAFKNVGFSDKQALALSAEVGRENGYQEKNVFGSHTDAANGVRNTGFFSWQGDRSKKLMARLASKGLVDKNGGMLHSQEALNEMAAFAKDEMSSGQYKGLGDFMSNKNIDPDDAAKKLGKGYIKWAYGQDVLRNGTKFNWRQHDSKRAGYYGQLEKMQGSSPISSSGNNSQISNLNNGIDTSKKKAGNTAVDLNKPIGEDGVKGEGSSSSVSSNNSTDNTVKKGGGTSGFSSGLSNSLANVKFAHSDIDLNRVHPELYNRLGKLGVEYKAKFGKDLVLNSAWRSVEKQARLSKAAGNSKYVAKPGHSMHNFGYALDVNKVGPTQSPMIPEDMLAKYGLYRPMMTKKLYEPWHIEPAETRGVRSNITRGGLVPNIASSGAITSSNKTESVADAASNNSNTTTLTVSNKQSSILGKSTIPSLPSIRGISGDIKVPNKVDYSNISTNKPTTDKNIAITNASTDVKGLAIKDAITEQTNMYNSVSEEGNGKVSTNKEVSNTPQININTSKLESLLEQIARNTGEVAKKDYTVNVPASNNKPDVNLFNHNTKINPYASYTDNKPNEQLNKRLKQANIIAKGT